MVLVIIGFGIYAFNLNNPLFWDDMDWIVNNPFVHSFSSDNAKNWFTKNILAGISQTSNYYRPLLLFTFTVNYILGENSPISYHLLSNILHIANAVLIFSILWLIFNKKFIAFWTSLIWLIHPLQTEAVTYISGRGDPLTAFFMLLALWLITRQGLVYQALPGKSELVIGHSLLVVSYLVLALLSRETAIVFPFLLMVFYISFLSRERFIKSLKTAFIKALPYFGVVFVYGVLRLTILNFENTLNFYSQSNVYTESLIVRMYTFLNVLWAYAGFMILPLWQHMERSVTIYTYFGNIPVASSFMVLLAVLGLLRYLYKKENLKHEAVKNSKPEKSSAGSLGTFAGFKAQSTKQIQDSKSQIQNISDFRILLFGFGWFFVNLGPTSGVTPINAQLYEHWLYLALLGPVALTIFYLNNVFEKFRKTGRISIIILLVAISVFFSTLSIKRNILWGDPIKFFENILKYEPDSARINNNLGYLYYDKGDKDKAGEYYQKAIETTGNSFPQPYFNLGAILQEKGDIRGAIVLFEKAIELDPNFSYPYPNLAVIYASQGDLVKAIRYLEKLKKLQPQLQRVYYNLALTYLERNDPESAYKNLQDGLKYGRPDSETEPLIINLLQKYEN